MSELMKIIEFVKKNSSSESVGLARMSLLVGENVKKISGATTADGAKVKKFISAAEEVTGKKYQ